MAGRVEGRNVILTGAAGGIGRAVGHALCSEGARVLLVDRDEAGVVAAADALRARAARCEPMGVDVTQEPAWPQIVRACSQAFGPPDALINNAAINRFPALADESLDGWSDVLAVNLTAAFLGMREVIPGMIERGHGAIVNVSSTWGLVGAAMAAAYQASKGGITMLTKHAAVAYGKHGLRVNSIHPGLIDTPMNDGMSPAQRDAEIAKHPLGRAGVPSEVATAVTYLISDEAAFVTGAALPIDGGYTAA
jgi:NAD(P)-dependent dehydrogenase (short-subunit alcohol dehydrogenase family)